MRTVIYIDGYNLYYGRLKNTPFKWLNIHGLFSQLVREQVPEAEVVDCRFYTAMTLARVASQGEKSAQAQQVYHRALTSPHTPAVTLIAGTHQLESRPLMRAIAGERPNKADRVNVWLLKEKQTDVRLSLDAYAAALAGKVDQVVLVSNDTDLTPLLAALKAECPTVCRGVIVPRDEPCGRPASKSLADLSNWMRRYIRKEELAKHQFRERVPTVKRPAVKPSYW